MFSDRPQSEFEDVKRLLVALFAFGLTALLFYSTVHLLFFFNVFLNRQGYQRVTFVARESGVTHGRFSTYYYVKGNIGDSKEVIYDAKDIYGHESVQVGETTEVYFDANAMNMRFAGHQLRVVSLRDFEQSGKRLVLYLSLTCLALIPLIVILRAALLGGFKK